MIAVPSPGAPTSAVAAPSTVARIISAAALRCATGTRVRWPPAMWPTSCAITPISWLGSSLRMIRPVFRNRFMPPATNAFSWSSLTM